MSAAPIAGLRTPALLIDADDTLWENNIYFEQAIAEAEASLAGMREELRKDPGGDWAKLARMAEQEQALSRKLEEFRVEVTTDKGITGYGNGGRAGGARDVGRRVARPVVHDDDREMARSGLDDRGLRGRQVGVGRRRLGRRGRRGAGRADGGRRFGVPGGGRPAALDRRGLVGARARAPRAAAPDAPLPARGARWARARWERATRASPTVT